MDTETVPLYLPAQLYDHLIAMARDAEVDPAEIVALLVANAQESKTWIKNLNSLRDEIVKEGGLQIGNSKDEVVEALRKTRREIFEAEYAHLYR